MSGFGRTGRKFAVDHWGVVPDIVTGGKGLGGGYAPIGGVYARDSVIEPLVEVGLDMMFYTFTGHHASCAVADKVLEIMEREDLVARCAEMGTVLKKRLAALESHPNVAEVRGIGLLQAVELVKDRQTLERFPAADKFVNKITAIGLQKGVFFYPAGSGEAQDVVLLGPPLTITEDEIDMLGTVLEDSINTAVAGR
jgi:adenosylmethionine-8-amino-7-oxononanoate aminotransferase